MESNFGEGIEFLSGMRTKFGNPGKESAKEQPDKTVNSFKRLGFLSRHVSTHV